MRIRSKVPPRDRAAILVGLNQLAWGEFCDAERRSWGRVGGWKVQDNGLVDAVEKIFDIEVRIYVPLRSVLRSPTGPSLSGARGSFSLEWNIAYEARNQVPL